MFKSLYPSLMGELNIAPNTQIGKIEIEEKVYDDENAYNIEPEKYSRGGEFIENLVTDNFIEYCHRWFKLADITELLEDIDEYYTILGYGKYSNLMSTFNSAIIPSTNKPQAAIIENTSRSQNALVFYTTRNEAITYNNLIEGINNNGKLNYV